MEKSFKSRPEHIKAAHTEDFVDHYWGSINYVFSLIKASELKAGLILSFYGILLNFIFQHIDSVLAETSHSLIFNFFAASWLVCTVISIYFSIRCFMPRIEEKYDKNIFFFGDVVSKFGTIKEFSRTFYEISLNEEELFDQLGQQIFVISKISGYKFRSVNRSLRFLGLGLVMLMAGSLSYIYSIFSSV
ncbi:Pycsar system effector family protein [Gramella sp. KN1008]|uniref:Pycsar system effector family protein n=1 Tax=Gramella sp. KN1008 TaxID=2529298 RepID=UPI00103B8198|nr:Pycsar system effector family protein [Gramella sp. KN1008]TBW30224.1 ABC transporter ATP-binding protein [Gramella sp. KN1008]